MNEAILFIWNLVYDTAWCTVIAKWSTIQWSLQYPYSLHLFFIFLSWWSISCCSLLCLATSLVLISASAELGSSVWTLTLKYCCCDGVSCLREVNNKYSHLLGADPQSCIATETKDVSVPNNICSNGWGQFKEVHFGIFNLFCAKWDTWDQSGKDTRASERLS